MNLNTLLEELSINCLDPKVYFAGLEVSLANAKIAMKSLQFTNDSRRLTSNPESLSAFCCISGEKFDGHKWVETSLEKQSELNCVDVLLLERDNELTPGILEKFKKHSIVVKNTRSAFSLMWSIVFRHPEIQFRKLGVTGTNGKTSITWLARELINSTRGETDTARKCLSIGTLGTIGLETSKAGSHTSPSPDVFYESLSDFFKKGYDCLSTEVSSHAIAQSRYFPTRFQVALISSFSRDHLDYHKNLKCYLKEKLRLFTEMLAKDGIAIFHESLLFLEDDLLSDIKQVVKSLERFIIYGSASSLPRVKSKVMDWGVQPELCAFVRPKVSEMNSQEFDSSKNVVIQTYKNFVPHEALTASPPGFGEVYAQNYLGAALAASALLKVPMECLITQNVRPVPGRFEPVYHSGRMFIVDYAHTPEGLEIALKFCQSLRNVKPIRGAIWCVFGCGGDRDKGKRPLMGSASAAAADHIVVTNDNPRGEDPQQIANEVRSGIPIHFNSVTTILNRREAIRYSIASSKPGDIILIAGKGHEDTQEINGQKYKFSDLEVLREELG